ncbi:DUF4325 domain-containing protein [Labilibaculum sp. A4]|uniref:STAS-like domain-containing protein n=1 Tax=Labilibaculum euxinus TaxID=2686357 RepID=UPI001365962A|nr:STAS-like domain-containing protein [Labilibaculum euxinus]MDQ1769362.1 STAS-like domain-containing protein [Labilibaculum euxinus]MWN74888.1 DUF4325 domain-containing protein [Labilibaculum euxinus]
MIKLIDVLNSPAAVSSGGGQKVFEMIDQSFQKKETVILDFNGISLLTSAFLNAAIGQLYNKYNSDILIKLLKLENISNTDKMLLKQVVERAKEYFKNKESQDSIYKDSLGDE